MKVPKPKKVKKISDWVLDDLVRKYIRLISGGYCKRCKKYIGTQIEVAHMYRRRRKTVRWDLRNVCGLCPDCHREIDNDAIKLTSFMYEVMTVEEVRELQRIANKTLKDYPIDREKIKRELKEKFKEVGCRGIKSVEFLWGK